MAVDAVGDWVADRRRVGAAGDGADSRGPGRGRGLECGHDQTARSRSTGRPSTAMTAERDHGHMARVLRVGQPGGQEHHGEEHDAERRPAAGRRSAGTVARGSRVGAARGGRATRGRRWPPRWRRRRPPGAATGRWRRPAPPRPPRPRPGRRRPATGTALRLSLANWRGSVFSRAAA